MKSKFEKDIKNSAYKSVPDGWDEIKKIAEQTLDENKSKSNKHNFKPYIIAAACLCIVIACAAVIKGMPSDNIPAISGVSDTEAEDKPVPETSTILNNHTEKSTCDASVEVSGDFGRDLVEVWAGSLYSVEVEDDLAGGIGKHINMNYTLYEAFEKSGNNTKLAFAVTVNDDTDYGKMFAELIEKCNAAKEEMNEAADKCIEKYTASGEMSYNEARARIYSDPEFLNARSEYLKLYKEKETAILLERYERNKGAVEELKKYGFEVVYDARDEKYQPYLSACNALAVMTATKEQLLSLENETLEYNYNLKAAAVNGEDYEYTDIYSYGEVQLAENSKITDGLLQDYKEADGEKLKVYVSIGYFGKEYTAEEINAAALAATGMTEEEYMYHGDMEAANKYRETHNRLTYHIDYNEEVVERLLKDGELVELQNHSSAFIAELTYDRVLELCENKEIAYIALEEEIYAPVNGADLPILE